MRRCGAVIAAVVAADQLIKALVRLLPQGSVLLEWPGVLRIVRCANTGVAFSLLSGRTLLVTALSALLLAALLLLLIRAKRLTGPARTALSALIGGGLGNLIDRLLWGSVTDYVQTLFVRFPVFNLADVCVTVSIGVLLLLTVTDKLEEKG